MFSQTTRLELLIVAFALLVLVFCSRPPQSGNAEIRPDAGPPSVEPQVVTPSSLQGHLAPSEPPQAAENSSVSAPAAAARSAAPAETAPVRPTVPLSQPRPGFKRIGIVDARNCKSLNYKDVMVGEVTVQWVWDGTKLVPKKVCKVTERNGVTSVWSFDGPEGVIITEIEQE